jgi:hypothetical protein
MKALSVAVAAALLAAPFSAFAQANNQAVVPITGAADNGTQFTGTFHVQRFQQIGNRIYALGVLNGNLGSQAVVDQAAALPVNPNAAHGQGNGNPGGPNDDRQGGLGGPESGGLVPRLGILPAFASTDRPLVIAAQTCPILHLTLGPIDLNLLGLMVHLNQVVLNIDAQGGQGNLLGNLLCAVANLLNGPNLGALTNALNQIINILNGIVAGL